MGNKTGIQYADGTVNLAVGCDGCELHNPASGIDICYAAKLIRRYDSLPGWNKFETPTLYPERLKKAIKWSDLKGTQRPEKPWLDGYPRIIFLDDLSDTFTESLPIDWMIEHVDAMENSKHIWLFLTKRPNRMAKFFSEYMNNRVPSNFWLGVTVTSQKTMIRAKMLADMPVEAVKYISFEPLWSKIDFKSALVNTNNIDWMIFGGESGDENSNEMSETWVTDAANQITDRSKTKLFVKQMGTRWGLAHGKNSKSGDWKEWEESLQVREMPSFK